jgi:hypothetical protein
MQVWFPEQKRMDQTTWFLWMRIVGASMAAMAGLLGAWRNFRNPSEWVSSLALASLFTFWRSKRPAESRQEFVTKPRAIITLISALAVVVTSVWFFIGDVTR